MSCMTRYLISFEDGLTPSGHLWVRAAGGKDGLLAANSVYQGLPLSRQTYLAAVNLICVRRWWTVRGGNLDRSGAQLSLVMVFSERQAARPQDVVGGDGVEIEVGKRVRE